MAEINYSVAKMGNPSDPDAPKKFYAKMQASGVVDLDAMAEEISYATTLTDGDVLNVLRALIRQMKKNLMAGKIVKMEKFGSFQFQIRSSGADKESDFTPSHIKEVTIQFRPGAMVAEAQNISGLKFKKVPKKKETPEDEGESDLVG